MKKKTVYIGNNEIAGFHARMAIALAKSNHFDIIVFNQKKHPFDYEKYEHSNIKYLYVNTLRKISSLHKFFQNALLPSIKFLVFIQILFRADACIFSGSKGFLNIPIDYYILRLFGKKVIHIYLGSTSRPTYMSPSAIDVLHDETKIKQILKRSKKQRKRVQIVSRAASYIIENPLCGHYQKKRYINYFCIGMPIEIQFNAPTKHKKFGGKLKILHCPSNPKIKGTADIQNQLTSTFLNDCNAEIKILSNLNNKLILAAIEECDVVIDQLYSDVHLAGFAAESAAKGKVPIVGGYGWTKLNQITDSKYIPPTLTIQPEDLCKTIKEISKNRLIIQTKSRELIEFLSNGEWSQKRFSEKLNLILNDEIPTDWWVEPDTIDFFHVFGTSSAKSDLIMTKLGTRRE